MKSVGVICGFVTLLGGGWLLIGGAFEIHAGLGWMLVGVCTAAIGSAVIAGCAS